MGDPAESSLLEHFFSDDSLRSTLASICLLESSRADPITHTILVAVTSPLQVQLTKIGLQPFQVPARPHP